MLLAAAVGLAVFGLALTVALRVFFPIFDLPAPAGPYGIGTVTYHWVDASRREVFVSDPAVHRELMVQVWYPAKTESSARREPYIDDPAMLVPLAHLLHLPGFVFRHLKRVRTNAVEAAPVEVGLPAFPLLVCSHGRGGYRQEDTWLVEELVSQGYIVAAIDHPYAASGVGFPDGRRAMFDARMCDRRFAGSKIPYLAQDASFALNELTAVDGADPHGMLTGHIDTSRVGIFGLSLGGEISAQAALEDERIRACMVIDAWMPPEVLCRGLCQPTMFLTRDAETMEREGWSAADASETLTTMRAVYDTLPAAGYFVQVRGMFHQDFSDAPLLSPLTSVLGLTGPIEPKRAHDILTAYSLAFFDSALKGQARPLLDTSSSRYPEVRAEARTSVGAL